MPSTLEQIDLDSWEFCYRKTEMRTWNLRRPAITFLCLLLSLAMVGCRASEVKAEVPDVVTGVVVDQETGARLRGVEVLVYINERHFVSVLGPEGTTRPKIKKIVGVFTDADGQFFIDLRKTKSELNAAYPNEKLVIERLRVFEDNYLALHEDYTGRGQILRLKKK